MLRDEATRIEGTESAILIEGEAGSGKGVLAKRLHRYGSRATATQPLVDLNCAGLGPELFESELFGHEKGAFTGAVAVKLGLLEAAHRGTVFLAEIGGMDVQVQTALLKVLEEQRFRRVGRRAPPPRRPPVDRRHPLRPHQPGARGELPRGPLPPVSTIPVHVPACENAERTSEPSPTCSS